MGTLREAFTELGIPATQQQIGDMQFLMVEGAGAERVRGMLRPAERTAETPNTAMQIVVPPRPSYLPGKAPSGRDGGRGGG